MPTVSRGQFKNTLQYGVDLNSSALASKLDGAKTTVDDLKALDKNGDGVLKGAELNAAFKLVDGYDKNGSGRSFVDAGEAGQVYAALRAGKKAGPYYGRAIAQAALHRAATDGAGYAYANAPTSPFKDLSHNRRPGSTRLAWLKNRNKCNQFVGDALIQAGVKMPTYTMDNGTKHYVNAERLPRYKKHFDRITDPKQLRPGDVIVVDYPGRGPSTAHTEVVTQTDPQTGAIKSAGAHADGAYERDRSDLLDGARQKPGGYWQRSNGNRIYLLRPKQLLNRPRARAIRP